jgi:hypothetical protein
MENYCDIVPHATGWVYVIDGVQSACYYHTYDLAMDAAKAKLAREGLVEGKVFRRQALNGDMLPITAIVAGQGAARTKPRFHA